MHKQHPVHDDGSIIIEVVEDIGENATIRHKPPERRRQPLFPPEPPTSKRFNDEEPTRLDRGLPTGLAADIDRGRTVYEPTTGEMDAVEEDPNNGRFLVAAAIVGGCLAALLAALILLYFIG